MQEEALSNELTARFYLSTGQTDIAHDHLREAVYLYERWGAKAKVNQLFQHYPTLRKADSAAKILKTGAPLSTFFSSRETTTSVLDLISILKASHAISSDIILESFLKRMIVIVMENAGAQQAHLILKNNNELLIEASSSIDGDTVEVLQSIPLESRQKDAKPVLPVDLINYVITTGESVVLDDATAALQFAKDPYIKLEQPKSLLCIPVKRQAELTGILYLENSQTTHVFTSDRVELLQMLSAQIAISIENAVLYKKLDENNQSLELNVALRTAELKEQNHLLQIAREEAEKANAAKTEFLANMSHELRAPMHAVLGYAKLGTDRIKHISREKLSEYLLEIRTSGERLLNLLNDLLDLSKMKAGKMTYCFKEASLASIIQGVASELMALLLKKNIELIYAKSEFSDRAIVDSEKIAQVFRNLISNAIKFSRQDGRIGIEMEDEATTFLISVKDQGVGIPETELGLIFEKFTQSSTTDTGAGGTGLGLSICEEIIRQHSGKIWAENNPEGGAVFRFRLPKIQPEHESAA
jgi:signal transduction histidine kinase